MARREADGAVTAAGTLAYHLLCCLPILATPGKTGFLQHLKDMGLVCFFALITKRNGQTLEALADSHEAKLQNPLNLNTIDFDFFCWCKQWTL